MGRCRRRKKIIDVLADCIRTAKLNAFLRCGKLFTKAGQVNGSLIRVWPIKIFCLSVSLKMETLNTNAGHQTIRRQPWHSDTLTKSLVMAKLAPTRGRSSTTSINGLYR